MLLNIGLIFLVVTIEALDKNSSNSVDSEDSQETATILKLRCYTGAAKGDIYEFNPKKK